MQFTNPNEIMNVMLLIGGEVIQKAILQMAGFSIVTPVVFSFGWVTYTFNSIANGGKDLPDPDYAVTVIPVTSRGSPLQIQNQSFLLGRLMRDLERRTRKEIQSDSPEVQSGMVVSVYEIDPTPRPGLHHCGPLKPCKDLIWWSFLPFLVVQLGVAAVPIILKRNWSIMLITACGNVLALVGASLPTIRRNKFACRLGSRVPFILTRGTGHKYAFLILPNSSNTRRDYYGDEPASADRNCLPHLHDLAYGFTKSQTSYFYSVCLCLLWVVLLIAVGGLEDDTWYLFAVGSLGMAHSVLVASMPRSPESHGVPLKETRGPVFRFGSTRDAGHRQKVSDTLLQLERNYPGAGHALLPGMYGDFSNLPANEIVMWESDDVSASSIPERRQEWVQRFYNAD